MRSALARLCLPAGGAFASDEGTQQECFTRTQAHSLTDDLCAKAQLAVGPEVERYLIQLFSQLPYLDGDSLDVLDACQEEFLVTLEKDAQDPAIRNCSDQIGLLLTLALARRAEPAAQAWVDVQAFANERKRINWGASDKTDAEKDYGRFLDKVMNAGLLRERPARIEPARLLDLQEQFPNFAAPIRFLAEQAAYARLCGLPFQPAPMLFTGPAGVGKTSFSAALAKVLGTHNEVVNMASQSCGFTLAGMDRGWSSARPGMVFTALLHGTTLAPVILLDEIDKTNEDARSSPMGPLYALLEPRTAGHFRDEYAGFPMDASHVIWLATANETETLPAPMLSRFKVFDIPMPSHTQLIAIARSMLRDMTKALPQGPCDLPSDWEPRLAGCSVRDLRLRLQEALGHAALRAMAAGAKGLTLDERDWTGAPAGRRQAIGFC
ncbi:AAA family ATPase [Massilia sp. LXY-6]|uniref:AAA family ATPase n=1 Tax=Massilia sp. LXY-6 TaxID=3379823 RepID=UPI003EE3AF7D